MCYWVGRRVVRVRCIPNFSLKRELAIFLVLRESSRINCCYFFNEASASALNVLIQTRPFLPLVTAGIYEAASSNGSLNLNGKADESWTPLNKKTSSLLQTFKYIEKFQSLFQSLLVAYDYKHLHKCYRYNFMLFTWDICIINHCTKIMKHNLEFSIVREISYSGELEKDIISKLVSEEENCCQTKWKPLLLLP